ncbi:adenosine deaminase family protein [Cordyceps fumosorosea ARSEF 2679]|uniref:adenosine deaminase n=1 Tax=Cordyceps fumosorosea (strain ARSEF 2679) TaxID=1081104 RepID=A0A167TMH8_CORFA|nr:adenosine deaminase family protein [Cordyceps fumosorosea ARSEF 2679]OAA60751.1 adenosine deaminase family protein [Cordyceps fumosorosea ARSEF 2679]
MAEPTDIQGKSALEKYPSLKPEDAQDGVTPEAPLSTTETDAAWEEIAQQIPSIDDPFLQRYLAGRESLIANEKTQRADVAFRKSLSPIAKRACRIVERIRAEEQRTIWTSDVEERMASESPHVTVFPGMMFSMCRERMESTTLWRIVRRMPKGSLLHAHLEAMVDFDYLIRELLALPNVHIASDRPLASHDALVAGQVTFRYRAKERVKGTAVWSADYKPGKFLLLTKMADEFPGGGRDGFVEWLVGRCTLHPQNAHHQHHGIDAIWDKFQDCFIASATIMTYEPMVRAYLRALMRQLLADGVRWAELRFAWPLNYCRDRHEQPEPDYWHLFTVIREEVARFRASDEGRDFWGLGIIWTSLRSLPTRPIVEDMDHCITTKMEFPELVVGYDVVGYENRGRTLRDLLPELFWFRQQCAQEGVSVPFFFHAGETLGDGDGPDANLFDAVLLGTRRIGHGYSLYKHPVLVDMVRERRVLVEACPISNEVLRLCGSVAAHPLPALLARGVPCCLCNDDPAMMGHGSAGMSHDFWQALQGWHNLGLAGLASLAENSVRWSAFEDEDNDKWMAGVKAASLGDGVKARRLQEWQVEWERFCLWVVDEYGEQYDDTPEPEESVAAGKQPVVAVPEADKA